MKSVLITGLRLIVTAAMLAWIFNQVDLRSLGGVMAQADLRWIILGMAVYSLSVVFAAWRWQRVLAGLGFVQRLPRMVRLVLSGAFFNMFLPSSVGGDVMKMVLIAPDVSRREVAISSVLMDRVIGLAVTIGVGLAAVLLLPQVWGEPAVLATLALAVIVFCIGMVTIFNSGLIDLAGRIAPKFIWKRLGDTILRVHESLMLVAQNPQILLQTSAISVLRQLVICLSVYFASLAFGMTVSPIIFFAAVPIAVAITALPVAINGLGLQDNALIFLLGATGVTAVEALSLSIFLHALRNGIGLLGGVIFAFTRHAHAAEIAAAQPEPAPTTPSVAE